MIHRATNDGGALIVGLILLAVLTMLGVAGMKTSIMELTMAGNKQFSEDAFQAAETGIDRALQAGAFNTGTPTVVPRAPVRPAHNSSVESRTEFQRRTRVPEGGFSLGEDGFEAYHFEVMSTGHRTTQLGFHAPPVVLRSRTGSLTDIALRNDNETFLPVASSLPWPCLLAGSASTREYLEIEAAARGTCFGYSNPEQRQGRRARGNLRGLRKLSFNITATTRAFVNEQPITMKQFRNLAMANAALAYVFYKPGTFEITRMVLDMPGFK